MAEGNDENLSPDHSRSRQSCRSADDSDDDDSMIPDLGVENIRGVDKKTQNADNHSATFSGASDTPTKREENPFSFKHFLKRDPSSYHNQGARPKIYTTTSSHASVLDISNHGISPNVISSDSNIHQQARMPSEFSSALPDFVQDHLVIEQCYLGHDTSPQELAVDINNLPDFTPNRNEANRWKDSVRTNERRNATTPSNLPLDLPTRPRVGFPLDLPLTESQASCSRSCPPSAEVGVSKSLPDFLSDGAVYSQPEDNTIGQSPERETDRLRRELELCRRQLSEQTRRADQLQRQLDVSRNKEHEYTQYLTKAMEQVEDNLNINNRRAATAENTVVKLKQEVKQLTDEIAHLQKENRSLRCEGGAMGGPSFVPNADGHTHRFAEDLRAAANTAEVSLRQLLGGVNNLRIMASSIENTYRIEERTDPFLSDVDEDTGPAL